LFFDDLACAVMNGAVLPLLTSSGRFHLEPTVLIGLG
jgi:hypothetical protein